MRTIGIKPRSLYVITFVAAFCMGFLVRHVVAVREKNNELARQAENKKYIEQMFEEDREIFKKRIDDQK